MWLVSKGLKPSYEGGVSEITRASSSSHAFLSGFRYEVPRLRFEVMLSTLCWMTEGRYGREEQKSRWSNERPHVGVIKHKSTGHEKGKIKERSARGDRYSA